MIKNINSKSEKSLINIICIRKIVSKFVLDYGVEVDCKDVSTGNSTLNSTCSI